MIGSYKKILRYYWWWSRTSLYEARFIILSSWFITSNNYILILYTAFLYLWNSLYIPYKPNAKH